MIFGYTTGVFDMFHIGHLRLLERAKANCDQLIVGITTDELCLERKGKLPVVPFEERRQIVAAVRYVDMTVPQTSMNKRLAWEALRFNKMFVGDDWRGTELWNNLEREFAELGVEIVYFPYTPTTSSTMLREALDGLHGSVSND
ncbi:adenylyltransferase/cytidyltransferase family protein [Mycolicibacterium phlei]|uniref:adenylyltransferase/cytidyltransferase family protein n=1 Tax=Mycolicibacterium phlei TaxID=1771 RepID=UPI00025AEDFB|nr:adenylyltransferase/cytidyltransferase family protein [Mycolicibacterium phlei]EID15461.1 cytidyltransferase-related domain-containing protein [Mycolicibacterium phlei RIVM601174]MBF4191227.1 cytidyltransferase-related domain-containing protein [Mycolicibacterium phlei]